MGNIPETKLPREENENFLSTDNPHTPCHSLISVYFITLSQHCAKLVFEVCSMASFLCFCVRLTANISTRGVDGGSDLESVTKQDIKSGRFRLV